MMLARFARGRVNPLAPAAVVIAGLCCMAAGYLPVGIGVAVGALLAYVNGLVLSRRVDVASLTGNVAGALMVMQVGLFITLALMAGATIVLLQFSVRMAVAAAAGFAAAHLAILATYYWAHGRVDAPVETKA